ncbi:helix-turn-helix domain-containing protein [Conexibacter woesei]|uniref:Helix-turn-helix domain protein n=1 Tax=Conexibacter woesei (strain DSM 14684 / CCUG 47730 / CIP 108061 / JCM 11494 / NBRC 100937 / ID131577) TaxID=469383 RepID=D3F205_CONWI|nr:helix-turn-helix transcriptional regulator [Conexibacter woesei]ADB50180.1 helix-turn-helix domain protein [Conexibacter woesei DSM 14684]
MATIVTRLKLAIVASGRSQRDVAAAVGISEFKLSRIVNGRAQPDDATRAALARELASPRASLFDDERKLNAAA